MEVEEGRQRQLQCSLLYPGERLRYVCLLKAFGNRQAERRSRSGGGGATKPRLWLLSPLRVDRHCMRVPHCSDKKGILSTAPRLSEEG